MLPGRVRTLMKTIRELLEGEEEEELKVMAQLSRDSWRMKVMIASRKRKSHPYIYEEFLGDVATMIRSMRGKISIKIGGPGGQRQFPCYSGGDPHKWLDKAEHYFAVYEIRQGEEYPPLLFIWMIKQVNGGDGLRHYIRRMEWTTFEQEFISQWVPSLALNHHGQLAKLNEEGKI